MIRDLALALRTLRRSVGYSLAVVLTLALGIGGTAAVTSVLHSVLLRPLSYAPADRVVMALERDSTGSERLASYPTFRDWRSGAKAFEGLAFVRGLGAVMKTGAGSERLIGAYVSEDFFRVLADTPLLGRTLAAEDFTSANATAVVLSHRLWQRRFGGDRSALGRTLVLGGRSYTVVGSDGAGLWLSPVGRPVRPDRGDRSDRRRPHPARPPRGQPGRGPPPRGGGHSGGPSRPVRHRRAARKRLSGGQPRLAVRLTLPGRGGGLGGRRSSAPAADRRRGLRVAHRLRQHRQPLPGSSDRALSRARDP